MKKAFFILLVLCQMFSLRADEAKVFYELLEKGSPIEQLELLREMKARGIAPQASLSKILRENPYDEARRILLAETSFHFMKREKWLSAEKIKNFKESLRLVLWNRGIIEVDFAEAFSLNTIVKDLFSTMEQREKNVALMMLIILQDKSLLDTIVQSEAWGDKFYEFKYLNSFQYNFADSDLLYKKGDSLAMAELKLSILRDRKAEEAAYQSFDRGPVTIQRQALVGRPESLLRKKLNAPAVWLRAMALRQLFLLKWDESVSSQVLKKGTWLEVNEVVEGMLLHRKKITPEWVASQWSPSSGRGRRGLCEFLTKDPRVEWWSFLQPFFDQFKADREILLKTYALTPKDKKSSWLLKYVEDKKLGEELVPLAFIALSVWHEPVDGNRYVNIYYTQKYAKGKDGGEELMILVGKNKVSKGKIVITRHLNPSPENPYMSAAIKASGFYKDPSLAGRILTLMGQPLNKITDPVSRWAILSCRGEDLPYPTEVRESTPSKSFSYKTLK